MLPEVPEVNAKQTRPERASHSKVSALLRFCFSSDDGNATIESVLWLPFFVALFSLIVDGSIIFNKHSNVLRIVHDANRAFSVGRYESGAETENMIIANAAYISGNLAVSTSVTNGVIATVVQVPVADLDITGLFSGLSGVTLTVNAQHYLEL